jgi:ADP-ribose pyrophosphatase
MLLKKMSRNEVFMDTHFEKKISSEVMYAGRVITVTRDTALLENGKTALRDVVHHHGGACILPYFEDGTICMVRQFRYAMQQELWELPAGKLEKGEDPFKAAQRELTEECGLTADEYISLGEFYPTVGYDNEIIYIWAARGLHQAEMHLDADEFLTPERVPLDKAYDMVMSGEIKDGKTIAGVLKLKALLAEGKV